MEIMENYTLSKTDHDYKALDVLHKIWGFITDEQHIVSNIGRHPKSFWRYINLHIKTRSGIDSIQCPDGSIAISDQEKAELLNSYFASVFTDENLASFPSIESEVSIPKLEDIANITACFNSIWWIN